VAGAGQAGEIRFLLFVQAFTPKNNMGLFNALSM
jgi:hypothetical protein